MIADMGMYQEFPLPGAIGMGIQPWMRPEHNVVWEVCYYGIYQSHDNCCCLIESKQNWTSWKFVYMFLIELFTKFEVSVSRAYMTYFCRKLFLFDN